MKLSQTTTIGIVEAQIDGRVIGHGTIHSNHITGVKHLCVTDANGDILHSGYCDEYVTYDYNVRKIESVLTQHLKQEQTK